MGTAGWQAPEMSTAVLERCVLIRFEEKVRISFLCRCRREMPAVKVSGHRQATSVGEVIERVFMAGAHPQSGAVVAEGAESLEAVDAVGPLEGFAVAAVVALWHGGGATGRAPHRVVPRIGTANTVQPDAVGEQPVGDGDEPRQLLGGETVAAQPSVESLAAGHGGRTVAADASPWWRAGLRSPPS